MKKVKVMIIDGWAFTKIIFGIWVPFAVGWIIGSISGLFISLCYLIGYVLKEPESYFTNKMVVNTVVLIVLIFLIAQILSWFINVGVMWSEKSWALARRELCHVRKNGAVT